MKTFSSAQELRDFIASIPENKFCRFTLQGADDRNCTLGHINKFMTGSAYNTSEAMTVNFLGISIVSMIRANDHNVDSKRAVLEYIDSVILENQINNILKQDHVREEERYTNRIHAEEVC